MNKKPLALGIMSGLMALSHNAVAASDSANASTPVEKTTVITASRTAETVSSLPQTVQVIDQEQIQQQVQPGNNLADILPKLIPGLGAPTQVATQFGQTLRGRPVLILIDGVSQYDNRNISRKLSSVSPEMVARIEVVSGASAIYGAGGAGGVINIITKDASKESVAFETRLGLKTSTEELDSDALSYNAMQSISGTVNKFSYLATVSGEIRKGMFDADGDRIAPEPAQTSRSDADSLGALVKLGYQFDADKSVKLTFDWYEEEQDTDYAANYGGPGVPALFGADVSAKAVKGLELDDQPRTERTSVTLDFTDQDLFGSTFRGQAYYREREYRFYPFGSTRTLAIAPAFQPAFGTDRAPLPVVNQSTSEAEVYGTKLTLETSINDDANVIWGLDYNVDKGKQTARGYDVPTFISSGGLTYEPIGSSYQYGPEVETETKAAFAQLEWDASDTVTVRTGVRYENINVDVDDATPPLETWFWDQYGAMVSPFFPGAGPEAVEGDELDYDAWLFNFGVIDRISDNTEIFINYSEGFELPDAARLLRDGLSPDSLMLDLFTNAGGATDIGDSEFDAIKVKNYELGWRGHWESASASITAFYNKSDKTAVFNSDYTVDMLDQVKTISGIESTLDVYVNNSVQTGGTFSYTKGETKGDDGKKRDLQATEASPAKLTAYIQLNKSNFTTRLQSMTIFDYNKAARDDNGADIDGYTTLDLLTQVAVGPGNLQLNVNNLLNNEYQTVYSQWAEDTYGSASGLNAEGRTLSMSYHMEY
jgi:iron complex outermembrane receptor protein